MIAPILLKNRAGKLPFVRGGTGFQRQVLPGMRDQDQLSIYPKKFSIALKKYFLW